MSAFKRYTGYKQVEQLEEIEAIVQTYFGNEYHVLVHYSEQAGWYKSTYSDEIFFSSEILFVKIKI